MTRKKTKKKPSESTALVPLHSVQPKPSESTALVPLHSVEQANSLTRKKTKKKKPSESTALVPLHSVQPKPSESTALVPLHSVQSPPVLKRYRERRKFVAIRLREGVVDALDRYVSRLQEENDTVTRTEIVEQAIKQYLRRHGAYEE